MPAAARTIDLRMASKVCEAMFAEPDQDLFGIEIEWHLRGAGRPSARPAPELIDALDGTVLPAGGRVSFEPGGQVELSTSPALSVAETIAGARADGAELHARLDAANMQWSDAALDCSRAPLRVLDRARYTAMESFFAARGPAGAWMMTNTASTQINVSHSPGDATRRWRLFHRIGPILAAAFANSPGRCEQDIRWACLRGAIWWSIDPGRTRPVRLEGDPATAWRDYALDADVMFISSAGPSGRTGQAIAPGLPFGRWLVDGHALGWPTADDLRYHLTTLFPPVRPKCWLELRFLDALPAWVREVAALVVAVLACDELAADTARLPDASGQWLKAYRRGLADPDLAAAADRLFVLTAANLAGLTQDPTLAAALEMFMTRYVERGRSPGAELPEANLRTLTAPGRPAVRIGPAGS